MTSFQIGPRLAYFIKYKMLGFIGLLILLLAIYLGTSVYHDAPSWLLGTGIVALAMMYLGFLVLRVGWAPPDGDSSGFGDCAICGRTDVGVAIRGDAKYCKSCYKNGAAQAYFDGMEKQSGSKKSVSEYFEGGSYARPRSEPSSPTQPPPPPQVKEIIKEREVIHRETIVKIRCGHCRRLFDEEKVSCPYCGAPA